MELWRKKNTDTRILFPIVDADGDPTSHADDNTPDSEWISWDTADHGGGAPSFADCTHEYVEIANGIYYLDVSAAEINKDYTLIQCKTALAGCKTQILLIRTTLDDWTTLDIPSHIADHVWDEAAADHVAAGSTGHWLDDIYDDSVLILADTGELQTDLVNGGRLDLLIDSIITKVDAVKAETALIVADTGELQTDLVNGGRLDLLIDAIKTKTDTIPADIAHTVLDEVLSGHLTDGTVGNAVASIPGKKQVVGNQEICYAEDNVTELFRFDLVDSAGDPTMVDVYKRTHVAAP